MLPLPLPPLMLPLPLPLLTLLLLVLLVAILPGVVEKAVEMLGVAVVVAQIPVRLIVAGVEEVK
jgi:hypothetical protein